MVAFFLRIEKAATYYYLLFISAPQIAALRLNKGGVNILGIIGTAILVVSVLAYPDMYVKFFRYIFDSVFGEKGVFEGKPKPKNRIYGPGGK